MELRLAPDESLYVINLTGNEAPAVERLPRTGQTPSGSFCLACIGASICQAGVRDSQKLLTSITEAVSASELSGKALPGCTFPAALLPAGHIRLGLSVSRGGVKLINKVAHPAFTLYVHGCDIQGREAMGEKRSV